MYIRFFIDADDAETAKNFVDSKLSILNVNNVVFIKNEKYWKIETEYEVLVQIDEVIEETKFNNFLDDIAYNWEVTDPRYLIACRTSDDCKVKEHNNNIHLITIFRG